MFAHITDWLPFDPPQNVKRWVKRIGAKINHYNFGIRFAW